MSEGSFKLKLIFVLMVFLGRTMLWLAWITAMPRLVPVAPEWLADPSWIKFMVAIIMVRWLLLTLPYDADKWPRFVLATAEVRASWGRLMEELRAAREDRS